jgi:hypothetical protein
MSWSCIGSGIAKRVVRATLQLDLKIENNYI